MARIIPGVQVSVVKDVVPPQLAPSGVLGIVGVTEKGGDPVRASSWKTFLELCGPGSAYSLPEARQALQNGVFELVVSPVDAKNAGIASIAVPGSVGIALKLQARAAGAWASGLGVKVIHRTRDDEGSPVITGFDVHIQRPGGAGEEVFRNLNMVPGGSRFVRNALASSSLIKLEKLAYAKHTVGQTVKGGNTLTLVKTDGDNRSIYAVKAAGDEELKVRIERKNDIFRIEIFRINIDPATPWFSHVGAEFPYARLNAEFAGIADLSIEHAGWPSEVDSALALSGSTDAGATEYIDAIDKLQDEADVDLVFVGLQDQSDEKKVAKVYGAVVSHCDTLSSACKGRIGFGHVPPTASRDKHKELASQLVSDRFVLLAPHGVAGAVAGMVGKLDYYRSPTFKRVAGLTGLSALGTEAQREYLKSNVVPVATEQGRGTIVIRGLTTDGDQINVRRTADRAVRGVKSIGDQFIGRLNNADGRGALKQKLTEFLLQMEKDGAIVPSTDGADPSFQLDVYSSQDDFAKGIVRVDIAVRPVRAIDYIYATILVET